MFKILSRIKVFSSIEYFGRKIKLKKIYFDVISYSADAENISMDEAYKLEEIMKSVPFGPTFMSKNEIIAALGDIQFPGYGSFYANQLYDNPEGKLEFMNVVIPRVKKNRYFVIKVQRDGTYLVTCDFVAKTVPAVRVVGQNNKLEFLSLSNETLFIKESI